MSDDATVNTTPSIDDEISINDTIQAGGTTRTK
jgi:hypothetical protein